MLLLINKPSTWLPPRTQAHEWLCRSGHAPSNKRFCESPVIMTPDMIRRTACTSVVDSGFALHLCVCWTCISIGGSHRMSYMNPAAGKASCWWKQILATHPCPKVKTFFSRVHDSNLS